MEKEEGKRIAEVLEEVVIDRLGAESVFVGTWREIEFRQLRKGDIFRLWDMTSNYGRTPDRTIEGEHEVCVCLSNPEPCESPAGQKTFFVQAETVHTRRRPLSMGAHNRHRMEDS
jgi:hypothetical protein